MEPKVEFFKGDDGQFYWHVKAANGEVVCYGEGYATEANAVRGFRDAWNTMAQVIGKAKVTLEVSKQVKEADSGSEGDR